MIREIFKIAQQTSAINTEPFFSPLLLLKHLMVQIYAYFQVYDLSGFKGPTPPRTSRISGFKISGLETNIFELKMMVKSGLDFFILKFY